MQRSKTRVEVVKNIDWIVLTIAFVVLDLVLRLSVNISVLNSMEIVILFSVLP